MKLMDEIEADQSGTIIEILVEDGKAVSADTDKNKENNPSSNKDVCKLSLLFYTYAKNQEKHANTEINKDACKEGTKQLLQQLQHLQTLIYNMIVTLF
ncbi:hypothetical protein J1N35_030014 [Gossypium stocksii]|uniref:Lipoyl-binding domain-containing protein n=1 Tax=Gossypium stocksii TaxID=47602 RepID=A0A9D3UYV4_9ROSI|nr:hypothetical protein J1N35_030014 [Gossypium stocksii]